MDRVKLLAWDGSGVVLVTKWLYEGQFIWPPTRGRAYLIFSAIIIDSKP
ncbi:MAG: hypothetical protein HKL84_06660 [Acidimicrobiaceae bacterium]|nr:hypothetical protein [Acidimicrobiaceae bacterium]